MERFQQQRFFIERQDACPRLVFSRLMPRNRLRMAAAAALVTTPETIAYIVSLGADVNDKPDGGSTVLDTCLRNFGWREAVWEPSYLIHRHSTVPASRLGKSLDALRFLLEKGARWTPDDRSVAETRRALYRVDGEAISIVVDLLRTHHACDDNILTALVRTEKMRNILAEASRQRASAEGHAKRVAGRETFRPESPPPAKPTPARLPPSRYDRQRLYEEVWSEPTQQVAKRYGVADVAIAKACALLDIPKPPRGYWAKKAAGQKLPSRPPLSKREGRIASLSGYTRGPAPPARLHALPASVPAHVKRWAYF